MTDKCCKKPDVVNMDYYPRWMEWRDGRQVGKIENRHCNNCGHHWWDGKEYTRKEWEALLESGDE